MAGKKVVRFGMVWTEDEARALTEWCWANRVKSESAAVRAFIAHGLAVQPPIDVPPERKRTAVERELARREREAKE